MKGLLEKIGAWLQGRKTYITAVFIGVGAALEYLGIGVPQWVILLLASCGFAAVRSAIGEKNE